MGFWEQVKVGNKGRGESLAIWLLVLLFLLGLLLAVIFSFTGGSNQFG